MSRRRNISEKVKNIIILLLLISAVFLGWQSQLFGNTSVKLSALTNPADDKPADPGNGVPAADINKTGEARPVSIAVTDNAGAHYGEKFNLANIESIYQNAVLIFHDALGTAQAAEKTDEKTWREALRAPGVYFEYMSSMRLSVLDGWFGTEITEDWRTHSVRRLCVAVDGAPRLYFQDDETGAFYAADTDVLSDSITKLTGLYTSNDTAFAFEILDAPSPGDPYVLILPASSHHPIIEAANPLTGETLAVMLRYFGVSEHSKPITEEDGSQTYIPTPADFRIELSPDGTVVYKRTGNPEETAAPVNESGAIELARLAVAETIAKYCGKDARVYFDAVSSSGPNPNSFQVIFTYMVAGGRVWLDRDGYAASVTVTNGAVSKMELRFRSFAITDQESKLLPEIQAAAAAGGAFMLCYSDNGDGVFEPSWVVISHNS